MYDLPRMAATKLLAQVCDQQPECLQHQRVLALCIILNGLVEDPVDGLVTIICTLRLNMAGDPIRYAISYSHDGRLEAQETRCEERGAELRKRLSNRGEMLERGRGFS